MIKRLISFACCLLPLGAGAVVVNPELGNTSVSTESEAWQNAGAQSIVIKASDDFPVINGIVSQNGFSIANNLYLGMVEQGSESGDLYILSNVSNPFTIVSQGDVSVGAILQVLNGKNLTIKSNDSSANVFDLTIGTPGAQNQGVFVGTDSASASFAAEDIDAFTVNGSVLSYGDFSVVANSVNVTGGINVNSGDTNISATGAVQFSGLTTTGAGTTVVSAGGAVSSDGAIQNNAGDMTIGAGGGIEISGILENTAAGELDITGGDMIVSETMANKSQSGTIRIDVDSLKVNGGTQATYSVVNNGNFYATVSGTTMLANGINLGGMSADNEFSLDTGTLTIANNSFGAFSNFLNNFNLQVRSGDIDTGKIQNGLNADGVANAGANMTLGALNISADSIVNSGDVFSAVAGGDNAGASDGNFNVADQVVGAVGSDTTLSAQGTLDIDGAVSNSGKMVLNGNNVSVSDVVNAGVGADLTISSLTAPTGKVVVGGTVSNTNGTTTIWAKDVSITGAVTNNSGTTTILGSDTNGTAVQIGAIDVAGGQVNLDALAGAVQVSNGISVSDGTLNLGDNLKNLDVTGSVQVDGDIVAGGAGSFVAGDMNITSAGNAFTLTTDSVTVGGDIDVTASDVVRNVRFDVGVTQVAGNVNVANLGLLTLGTDAAATVDIAGDLSVNNGGTFETYANNIVAADISGNGLFLFHGENVMADDGNIDIDGNLYFDPSNDPLYISSGVKVRDTNEFTLKTTASGTDISVGAVSVGSVNTLNIESADAATIDGTIVNNGVVNINANGVVAVSDTITNKDDMSVSGASLNFADVTNTSVFSAVSTGDVVVGNVSTSGETFDMTAGTSITVDSISQTNGVMNLGAYILSADSVSVNGAGSQANLNAANVYVTDTVSVGGDFVQGGNDGMLNHSASIFAANNLVIGGDFNIDSGSTTYNIGTALRANGVMNVLAGTDSAVQAGSTITVAGLTSSGELTLTANNGLNLGDLVNNADVLTLDSRTGVISLETMALNGGNIVFSGAGLDLESALNTSGMLYQAYRGVLDDKDINISATDYVVNASNLNVAGIKQQSGKLVVNSSDIDVGGNINATDLRFVAVPTDNWMNVNVNGSVSGAVDFIGLEKMTVSGDYVFDSNSNINAVVLPYAAGSTLDSTDVNYWSNVALGDDNIVRVENASDGAAMINVAGTFTAGNSALDLGNDVAGTVLEGGQIGISLRDIVEQGTAIWFVHADGGVENAGLLEKVRNLDVRYCNADGSLCYDYLESLDVNNGTGGDAGAYVAARDNDLYIVFDPRFGGPIEVFKLQPIVATYPEYTNGEFVSAGALDDMIAGRLKDKKFFNRTPIEVIPLVFRGTNMQEMANQLYYRMEYYAESDRNPDAMANFSRLFQARELEQIAGTVVLNEHTAFRSFEDRMFDEFIWNRNRNLKKAWVDVDFGMLYQNVADGKHTDGNRFSISGGFDWQESNTLQLGLTGRIARTTSKVGDKMDLGYIPGQSIDGRVDIDVADTNIAFGAYLMKTASEKARVYGNAFIDMHVLDVNRTQNYVGTIDGDGTAFSLISEWGVLHDILNQYVVGNLYVRGGYNFGFDVKEKVGAGDYMRLQSDGYFIFTPGYSLTAQKRIYPSAWFQIRPYASIGVEYDVLGAPDKAEYKFAPADAYTKYEVEIDPLWANIGGGVELLSANGLQFGVDYRYQYNSDIQLHNIKISGSYRF